MPNEPAGFLGLADRSLTARVSHIVNISRVLSLIRDRDRVPVFVQVHIGPSLLGGVVVLDLVVSGNLGWTWIRGNIAAMYRLLAGIVALREIGTEGSIKVANVSIDDSLNVLGHQSGSYCTFEEI